TRGGGGGGAGGRGGPQVGGQWSPLAPALPEVGAEALVWDVRQLRDVPRRLRQKFLRVDARLGDVAVRFRLVDQPRDDRLGELEVKLEAVDGVAPAKRLLLVTLRARKVRGVGRELVAVALQLQH